MLGSQTFVLSGLSYSFQQVQFPYAETMFQVLGTPPAELLARKFRRNAKTSGGFRHATGRSSPAKILIVAGKLLLHAP